jgi:DNA polymerase-3 subunit alpha
MVYQEQVMQMAQVVGGYSLGGADLLRRAMGKKESRRDGRTSPDFPRRCSQRRFATRKADEIFDLMEKFAGYGF